MKKLLKFLQDNHGWQSIAKSETRNARKLAQKGLIYLAEYTREGTRAADPQCRLVD